ncbi:LOW QUALITY PROTEIN: putative SWI/SNF-related matrix-associated actin-dependent regulator of chromatin subfamily A member 3-like 1 [Phoenix dactylifera]|uniref:LOW QUALITY PROTEIN: putative SWI/SNF-related matrix-associated actin-dependent regulator of chromatin subfamily A member 3-like 1 n=1 Tax=Phoenix dactylifera TaxID=42345 RepID=A0A8B8ZY14_PHODC|nr:LOW QUALITY PROTEIN: putative SWI/SNF-related matrix-associated actin-dependent regulator of chromatin subfamily A member 3-like 1 [Phoenix dactylifera]
MEEDDDLWQRYLELDDDDPGGGPDSQHLSSSPSSPSSYLAGFLIANIVGLRYYSGTISGREMVGLVREPLNPYDPNAIKVLNTRMAQIGHIERSVAAVLAPLLDSRLVSVEGIVPKPPKNRNPYRLPCQVHIFARPDAIPLVRDALDQGGLQLIDESDLQFGLSEAAIVQEEFQFQFQGGNGARRIDDIFALVGKEDEAKRFQLEPPKEFVVSELFAHQKEGLGWLVRRENSSDLPPFWEERSGSFVNVLTNYQTHERPEPLRGGIFADDMGLGKTLTLLSLIAVNGPGSTSSSSVKNIGGEDEKSRTLGRRKKSNSGKNDGGARQRRKLNDGIRSTEVLGSKTTLVVCPPSVFSSWITQLEEHTMPGSLKVYLYHGERTREPKELLRYDIVLTTYSTLAAEFSDPESPMKEIEWLRVILDEAHLIKNFAAQQTKAVIALKAERRWAVTGTPIQNSSFDLFSLMAFLRFQPFSIKYYWQSLVQRPLAQGSNSGLSRLQALMGTISLRRTKDTQSGNKSVVGLPPKTIETCFVELSAEECEYYDHMESEAQNTVREYIDADTVLRNYSTVLHIILRLRQICNDMALCPSDIKSFLPSDTLEDVSRNPELLKKLASLVEDGDDFDCPVCLSPPIKAVITCCAHIFCQACILRTLKHLNACCPICRHPLSKSDLFLAPSTESSKDDESKVFVSDRPVSSKVSTLLKLLLETKKQNPKIKSVIFSQFRKMLILLEEPLKSAGFGILRLDGSMSAKKRSEVIKEFGKGDPGAPTVLLASLKAAGAGVNLTAASRVYLVEPWWNPALEEQAMDRVHRIGQQQDVRVVRLIVRGSIEERILELQERKKKLASGAFGSKAAKEQKQMRVEDVRIVMRL